MKDIGAIEIVQYMGNTKGVINFFVNKVTPKGINIIENKIEFKKNFSFETGVPGLFKFSWGASEK